MQGYFNIDQNGKLPEGILAESTSESLAALGALVAHLGRLKIDQELTLAADVLSHTLYTGNEG